MKEFRVGLTRDFLTPAGDLAFEDIGLRKLEDEPHIVLEFLPDFSREVTPQQIAGYDAVISLSPAYTRRSLDGPDLSLSILARFGVGYDMLEMEALSDQNIIVTITPDGVRRPVASGIVGLILALAHQLLPKDRLVRHGPWGERLNIKSIGLTGRILGSVGLGNIGSELFRLMRPFEMIHLATDPFIMTDHAGDLGVRLVDLETLMKESDFVCVNCPLTPQTRQLVGARQLGWLKPTAFFINTSRGAVVDQVALYHALKENRIRGAALDVFETEPIAPDDPLLALDNVVVTPHSLCWTDECFRLMGESAADSVLAVLRGDVPQHVVNRPVLEKPALRAKLKSNRNRWSAEGSGGVLEHEGTQEGPA
jgi:phosphoglycerate dehydrogenase-like enzyme